MFIKFTSVHVTGSTVLLRICTFRLVYLGSLSKVKREMALIMTVHNIKRSLYLMAISTLMEKRYEIQTMPKQTILAMK
ncbi:hypothetical protein [Flectobacillus longus]|uniref:hypothetical protein n=1 Tax=Flectobacillus longus TaxID=2984207 RepID=UPI0024B77222|nr:hypothetical protein [Flectobacillus longus]MDI9880924.1 hypothetical protein [Flectobacillus longus]